MNTDIRLAVGFFDHPKTVKLERQLGLQGVVSLLRLWLWAAQSRPGGILSGMDTDDIEIVAGWQGEQGAFVSSIIGLRLLDATEDPSCELTDCALGGLAAINRHIFQAVIDGRNLYCGLVKE